MFDSDQNAKFQYIIIQNDCNQKSHRRGDGEAMAAIMYLWREPVCRIDALLKISNIRFIGLLRSLK